MQKEETRQGSIPRTEHKEQGARKEGENKSIQDKETNSNNKEEEGNEPSKQRKKKVDEKTDNNTGTRKREWPSIGM